MNPKTRLEIVSHALRWGANMIVEVISNHASSLPIETQDALRNASRALADAQDALRQVQLKD